MSVEAVDIASKEDLDAYAEMFGSDKEMVRLVRKCSECGEAVLVCDNGWLDAKPTPRGMCGVLRMGSLTMLASGDLDGGSRHDLHVHQPDEFE